MSKTNIKFKIINPLMGKIIPLPEYTTDGSAGIDLRACINNSVEVFSDETKIIDSGISIKIPSDDIAAVLLPRSGLGIKNGIVLGNLVGLIDSDYYKEIKIAIWNRGERPFIINQGDRICQMVFIPVIKPEIEWTSDNIDNNRGGLGSTGIN